MSSFIDYDDLDDIIKAVEDEDVTAGLIDYNLAMFKADEINKHPHLVTDDTISNSMCHRVD